MVYISSSACTKDKIKDVVLEFVRLGIFNIELSGGTRFYSRIEDDLLNLKKEFGINFLIHNYFPPFQESPDFVMNMAAQEENEKSNTFKIIKNAIRLSKALGSNLYTLHAGFDAPLYEKGGVFYKKLNSGKKQNRQNTKKDFYKGIDFLLSHFINENFKIGIENFFPLKGYFNSFFESQEDIIEFLSLYKKEPNIGLLLDLGHLNVAADSSGFNKFDFIDKLFSKYANKIFEIHISENNGACDSHGISNLGSWQLELVAKNKFLHDRPVVFEWRRYSSNLISQRFADLKRHIESHDSNIGQKK